MNKDIQCTSTYYINNHEYAGKCETLDEKLKLILAQFEFAYHVQYWEGEGVPFKTHLHVPERHPVTGCLFCEREDEGHVFKVWTYYMTYTYIHAEYLIGAH